MVIIVSLRYDYRYILLYTLMYVAITCTTIFTLEIPVHMSLHMNSIIFFIQFSVPAIVWELIYYKYICHTVIDD